MSWRGENGGIAAAGMGHKVVMAPNNYMYIDYYQSEDYTNEPLNIGGLVTLEHIYSINLTILTPMLKAKSDAD